LSTVDVVEFMYAVVGHIPDGLVLGSRLASDDGENDGPKLGRELGMELGE
jgi:hypothetical protein